GVFSVLAIHHGKIPPTVNYVNPDPDCDLDYVPNVARDKQVTVALSNSFGFGGTNAALIFKRFEE
ncbi:MAG: 3-oxoacyl-[acyl-carrier-protein] synthase, partial [Blastocatellia bacterium]|nr:3-oxoacyl-[acyl-carrier-protein] synthase [Blastocatellia bacterium]